MLAPNLLHVPCQLARPGYLTPKAVEMPFDANTVNYTKSPIERSIA